VVIPWELVLLENSFMKKFFESLPESVKETLKVITPLIVLVILSILVGKFGVSRIVGVREQISKVQEEENVLTSKLTVLKSLSESAVKNVSLVTMAFPGSNPSITTVSQLKNIALKNGVIVTGIKSTGSSASSNDIFSADTTFQTTGTRSAIMAFLKNIEEIAPLTRVEKVRISENAGLTIANIGTKSYWAPFPKTIPSVTGIVTDLNTSEKQLLVQIMGLIQPTFTNILPSANSGGINAAPFGQ
jgi:hypothetical protein